ncbi:unnamed protein product [Acanthoscelides obtectus]|uniref:Chitin-binding type-2 domain-containing protein n=1 Tax=Acanthoscelides obtectus TaxID=200917 RepID=A0A9P0KF36_ACAOB|nr:unnamed protein product [Acanthoscelides obtectus]CAK1667531.1 hypothetical protein AOBTE_LOCUS25894 [Acanthoscelides obtectus]
MTKYTTNKMPMTPPVCSQTGPGYYAARKCKQYYQCTRILYWNNMYLKTCPDEEIYDQKQQKCVTGGPCIDGRLN